MNKIGKFILWVAALFVLVAFGFLIMAYARSVSSSRSTTASMAMVDNNMGMAYGQATGLGLSGGVVSNVVRSFVKSADMQAVAPEMASAPNNANDQNTANRLIIKTGDLSVVVKDVREAIQTVTKYATTQGGFVVNSNVYKSGLIPRGMVTIRIPANKFDQGMNEVKTIGEVMSENSNGQDVTEEYVDLDAQLRNLRVTETQFLAIMAKAEKIADILNVQRELTTVRGEIERLQGRMKYLKQNADLSTITVNFSTDPSVLPTYDNTPQWKPWAEVKSAARALLEFGKQLVNVLIWLVIFVPVWAVIALVVWVIVKIVNRIKTKKDDGNFSSHL